MALAPDFLGQQQRVDPAQLALQQRAALARLLTPPQSLFESARQDPRLMVSAPAPGQPQLPAQSQDFIRILQEALQPTGTGVNVSIPTAAQAEAQRWLQQQPWYQSLASNPWLQAAAAMYMLRGGSPLTFQTGWSW